MDKRPRDPDLDYVPVNKLLGQQASIGPIPAEQLIPWVVCTVTAFFITNILFDLPMHISILTSVWLIVSWWMLTGKRSYQFTDRFASLPGKDYIDLSTQFVPATNRGSFKRKQKRPSNVRLKNFKGVIETFMPFQKDNDLHIIMEIAIEDYRFAVLLLCQGEDKWSAVIPFKFEGIHPELYREEVSQYAESIDEACKDLLPGESISFLIGCTSDYSDRTNKLDNLAAKTKLEPIALTLQSEKLRGQQLTKKGQRQQWYQYAFCTWTQNRSAQRTDWMGWCIDRLASAWIKSVSTFTGSQKARWENIYSQLAGEIFRDGYLPWQILLSTKAGLKVEPMQAQEIWQWLWYRFNESEVPPIPQLVTVKGSDRGLVANLQQNTLKDTISILVRGEKGNSSCPSVRDRQTIALNNKLVAAMALEDVPVGWKSTREQLKWLWSRLSEPHVKDTEAWVQVSPASIALAKDNLIRITKQASHANTYAARDGSVMDVNASMQQKEALEAQKLLYENKKPLYTALTLLIYRERENDLEKACALIANSFGTATLVRERRVAWKLWLETLPLNVKGQLTSTTAFSERRSHFDTSTVAGVLPLSKPKAIDDNGVEFIYHRGGFPIQIDLFTKNLRALMTAKSGGGKSVAANAFMKNALARNIPIVGMDASLAGDSTFQLITDLLGEQGAYIDLTRTRYNLLQPPDLRRFDSGEREIRFNLWKDSIRQAIVAIAMGNIHDPALSERVNAIVLMLLQTYLEDPLIIERYNNALDNGWLSEQWQQMSTLHDLLTFCSREKLGLRNFEEIDRRAINQIVNQVTAKLVDPNIGDVIGKPSNISPAPMMQIFSLSGLTDENNSYVMSLVAQMACTNIALAHPKSFFVMDECSVLLAKAGFAEMVGERFATGRKFGQSTMIIAQDLESISTCAAAAKILRNLDLTITGRTTNDATSVYAELLEMPRAIISRNATDAYLPIYEEFATKWLIAKDHRYWECYYYAPPIELAILANSDIERAARARFLSRYPSTVKGRISALVEFTRYYIASLRGGTPLTEVGWQEEKAEGRRQKAGGRRQEVRANG
jgi:hypothetical protein